MSDPKPTIDQGEGLGDLISAEEGRHRLEVYAARSKLTTWEAEVLRLEARVAELERDPNQLPMELLPEGWVLTSLRFEPILESDADPWHCYLESQTGLRTRGAFGPTPHAAMMAAIERIGK